MTFGARNVTVSFGSVTALQDVSLDAPAGAVTAVVGGDGAGKSTLLRCLVGLIVPQQGSVDRPPKRQVGYMCSSSGTWHDLTVDENVAFVAGAYGAAPRADLLARAGLASVGSRLAGQLSGGMRHKLGFVLAIQHNPELLVLDEPSTGLDPVSRVELWRMIAGAAAGGTAVVMSTTYLDEAERASSLLVLDAGRAVLAGRPDEVVAQTPGRVVEVEHPSDRARAWRRGRVFHEWLPDENSAGPPDLEDAIIVELLSL